MARGSADADLIWQLKLQADRYGSGNGAKLRDLLADPRKVNALLEEAEASGEPERVALARKIRGASAQDSANAAKLAVGSRLSWAWVAGAAVLLLFGGWLFSGSSKEAAPELAAVAPAVAKMRDASPAAAVLKERQIFRLHGSNTVGEELAPALIERWMKTRGASETAVVATAKTGERLVSGSFPDRGERWTVELHSHGSSTAFQDLAKSTADLGMSSRRIKKKEVDELAARYGDLSSPVWMAWPWWCTAPIRSAR